MPRHKEHGISRFNISSNLLNSHKFIAFHKELQKLEPGLPEESVLGILTAFWCFVANNRAMNGSIKGIETSIIAKQSLWFGNNRKPDDLIKALKNAKFVEKNGIVHDWFDHQPLAKEVLRSRKRRTETTNNTENTQENTTRIYPGYNQDITRIYPPQGKVREDKGSKEKKEKNTLSSKSQNSKNQKKTLSGETPESFIKKYNELADKFPLIGHVNMPISPKLREKILIRLNDKEFKPNEILSALRDAKWHHGDNDDGWAVDIHWIVKGPGNYNRLLSRAEKDRLLIQKKKPACDWDEDTDKFVKEHDL